MTQLELFYRFGIALVIGILIGMEREHAKPGDEKMFAGVRTFALLALAGCTAALLVEVTGAALAFIGVFGGIGALIAVSYFVSAKKGEMGLTTEMAGLLTVMLGALCYWDYLELAAALAVTITVLLSLKVELESFADRISRDDVFAALKFAVITVIILPLLPKEPLGPPPFDVLIPYNIWLMVVFIAGINFLGYVLVKLVGAKQGIGLTGFLGGLVSSTAVTLSFSERSQREIDLAKPFALAIIVAWTVMFARVLVEVAVINLALLSILWLPIAAAALAGLLYGYWLFRRQKFDEKGEVAVSNPFELGAAIKFGLLYAVVLLVSRTAQLYLGDAGIYLSSILSGLVDVDAITLSMAQLSKHGGIALDTAKLAIVLAAMSNTVVKGGIVLLTGTVALRKAILPGFLSMLIVGLGMAFLI
jgi:uncharacterized membrane protein (DUF4010 family)